MLKSWSDLSRASLHLIQLVGIFPSRTDFLQVPSVLGACFFKSPKGHSMLGKERQGCNELGSLGEWLRYVLFC